MQESLLIIYLVVAIALIGIILLQQGKGAEMGASFGAGGANTVFGAAGSGNVLTKTTTILAILFFAIALSISYMNSEPAVVADDVLDDSSSQQQAVDTTAIATELPAEGGIESQVAPSQAADSVATEAAAVKKEDVSAEKSPVVTEQEKSKKDADE